jgi:uncharacterized damage-inducible protein DinB
VPEEFEGDLRGAVFWGADLTGARFRDVDLTGATITHAWLVGVEIDALVERLVVNGVDVTDYVNERDPWYPLRAMLRPDDPAGMQAAWAALEAAWAKTLEAAQSLSEGQRQEQVDGEWSLVQTLRHLVFAMDKWFTAPVLGGGFHPIGITNSASVDFPFPGLDPAAAPSFADALAAREERSDRLRAYLAELTPDDLARTVDVLENGPHTVQHCLYTVFEEEFWHNRYATRDLARLA